MSIFLDRFTAGLDELTRQDCRDPEKVLAVLRRTKRFSVFEASGNPSIAKTIDELVKSGRLKTDHESVEYPWTLVTEIDGEKVAP